MENQKTVINEFGNWIGESILIKIGLIGMLVIILLIPSSMVQDLILERQTRQQEVLAEISDKWSGSQLIAGPVMILPYKTMVNQKEGDGKSIYKEVITHIYILPEALNVQSHVEPEILHRGIFNAVVYNAKVKVSGKFSPLELKKAGIDPKMILWDKAKIDIGVSDLKGLKNNPIIKLDNVDYMVEPDFGSLKLFENNLIILPDLSTTMNTALNFSFDLNLRGSNELSFLHLGKKTSVDVEGNWGDPSFTGRYLPEERSITKNDFKASWEMPHFNRSFPQQWIEDDANITSQDTLDNKEGVFGVKFIVPVDQYQKTMRTAKYAILIILLTFISLLFTEILTKTKVHLLQYVLIGVSMIIYYILLLSFSEHLGFNAAYLIASFATITLIGLFISALLKNKKAAVLFAGILTVFYMFVFVIIQLQDLALLFGSVGLFIIVAVMMYLSAKIDWSRKGSENR